MKNQQTPTNVNAAGRGERKSPPTSRTQQVKYSFESKQKPGHGNVSARKDELDLNKILADPDLIDKAGALSVLIKKHQNNASVNMKSATPTSEPKHSTTSELKRRPQQFISNFHRVKSPQALSWRFGGGQYDTTRCPEGAANQLGQQQRQNQGHSPKIQKNILNSDNGGGAKTSMHNHISESPINQQSLYKRNQGTSIPSGDLCINIEKGAYQTNMNLSDSKHSLVLLQAPQNGGKISKGIVPQVDWSKVGYGTDKISPSQMQSIVNQQQKKFTLDLSKLKRTDDGGLAINSKDHQQMQSERNAFTTERGLGVDTAGEKNTNLNTSDKSLRSLPEGRKQSGLIQMLNKGSMPEYLGKTEQLSKGQLSETMQKQNNSQIYQGQDSILESQENADLHDTLKHDNRMNSDLGQIPERGVSPNAIERNVMQKIENELFDLQKRNEFGQVVRDGNNDSMVDERVDQKVLTQQVVTGSPQNKEEVHIRQQLKFLLTGGDSLDREQQSSADEQPITGQYKAYSKMKKQNKNRSQTPHLLSYLNQIQIKPHLYLHNQQEPEFKQQMYPNLLSPAKATTNTIQKGNASSRNKAYRETQSNSVFESELIQRTRTQETSMERQELPSKLEIKVQRDYSQQPIVQNVEQHDIAISTDRQASDLTQTDFTNSQVQQPVKEAKQAPPPEETVNLEIINREQIDLSKLDVDPESMDKFEKLLLKLNPFSMNQIQKLSPKNNAVIENFMDAKKWRRLQQIDQQQFDQTLKLVIQNWTQLRGSTPMYSSEFKDEKQSSVVHQRDTPTQQMLLSKLSDKQDVETQGVEKGKDSQRSRLSKLSERIIEWDKRLKKKRQSYDNQNKQSERSSAIVFQQLQQQQKQQAVLFKTHIRVSPVEGRNGSGKQKGLPERITGKKSVLKSPTRIQQRNSKELIKRFNKGMVKIDQILKGQPIIDFNINAMGGHSFQYRPYLDELQLKQKLDILHAKEKNGEQAVLRIKTIDEEGNSRNQLNNKLQTPTSVDERLSHRLERSNQKTARSDEKKKEIQIVDGSQDQSSDDNTAKVNHQEFLSQKTLTRKITKPVGSASKHDASSGITSNAAFSFANKEGSRGTMYQNRSKNMQNRNKMILPENYISIYGQSVDKDGVRSSEKVNSSDQHTSKGHKIFSGKRHHFKIDQWTNNSNESLELPQEVLSNSVTFGSPDPLSRESLHQSMQIQGKNIYQVVDQATQNNSEDITKNGEVFKLALLSAQQMDLQSLVQHVATMRKMQIKQQEKNLQKNKNLLRELQQRSIDQGSVNLADYQIKSRLSNTPGPDDRRKPYLAQVHLDHLLYDQIGMHADQSPTISSSYQKNESARPKRAKSPTGLNNQAHEMRALEFLQHKFQNRHKEQLVATIPGQQGVKAAAGATGLKQMSKGNEKVAINQDLTVLQDPKTSAQFSNRSKQPVNPSTPHHRYRFNNSQLLQPLLQSQRPNNTQNTYRQSKDGGGTDEEKKKNQSLYGNLNVSQEEDMTKSSQFKAMGTESAIGGWKGDDKSQMIKQALTPSPDGQNDEISNKGDNTLNQAKTAEIAKAAQTASQNFQETVSQPTDRPHEVSIAKDASTFQNDIQVAEQNLEMSENAIGAQNSTEMIQDKPERSVPRSPTHSDAPKIIEEIIEANEAETKRGDDVQNELLNVQQAKNTIPENIFIQIEESLENEKQNSKEKEEIVPFNANPAPLVDQYSLNRSNVLSGETVGESLLSGQDLQKRIQSPDLQMSLQSSKVRLKSKQNQPMNNSTLFNRSSIDRGAATTQPQSMVVHGSAQVTSRANQQETDDTSNQFRGIKVQDHIYEKMIQQPERNSKTADPARSHLHRHKAKLYLNFRKQKNQRKEYRAEQSKMIELQKSSLQFDSTIINYQSPRHKTPGAQAAMQFNIFPGIVDANKYYGNIADQNMKVQQMKNMDLICAEDPAKMSKRLNTDRNKEIFQKRGSFLANADQQKAKNANYLQTLPNDLTNHQVKIKELHMKAQNWLKQTDVKDGQKQEPESRALKNLDLKTIQHTQTPEFEDQMNFTYRLQQAHKRYTQLHKSRPQTQETNQMSFRSQRSRLVAAAIPQQTSPIADLQHIIQTQKLQTSCCRSPQPLPSPRAGSITIPTSSAIYSPPNSFQVNARRPSRALVPQAPPGTVTQTIPGTQLQPTLIPSPTTADHPATRTTRLQPVFRGFTPLLAGRPRDPKPIVRPMVRPTTQGSMPGTIIEVQGRSRIRQIPIPHAAKTAFAAPRPSINHPATTQRLGEESKYEDSPQNLSAKKVNFDEMFSDRAIAQLEQRLKEELGPPSQYRR